MGLQTADAHLPIYVFTLTINPNPSSFASISGLFVSVNGPGFKRIPGNAQTTILYYISDNLIGQQPWLNESTTCEYPDLWRNKSTSSTPTEWAPNILANPSEYVGYYRSKYLPGINVKHRQGNTSSLSFEMNNIKGILHSTGDDRFLMEVTSPWELMTTFWDDNNATEKMNTTFLRQDGNIGSLEVRYGVNVEYIKDIAVANTARTYTTTYGLLVSLMGTCHSIMYLHVIHL